MLGRPIFDGYFEMSILTNFHEYMILKSSNERRTEHHRCILILVRGKTQHLSEKTILLTKIGEKYKNITHFSTYIHILGQVSVPAKDNSRRKTADFDGETANGAKIRIAQLRYEMIGNRSRKSPGSCNDTVTRRSAKDHFAQPDSEASWTQSSFCRCS